MEEELWYPPPAHLIETWVDWGDSHSGGFSESPICLFSTDPFLRIVSEYVGHTNTQNKRVQLALLINCKIFPAAKSVLSITE
jgi:hypothetical protein